MIFLNSNFLLFMLLPLIILTFFIVTNKKYIERVFEKEILKKLIIRKNSLSMFTKNILLFLTLFLFIVALSRPVLPKEEIELKSPTQSFALLLDISASMLAKDIYPNRLEFAKKKIKQLLNNTTAKISLYAFSKNLYKIAPSSTDSYILQYLIDNLKISHKISTSSNLLNALSHIKEKNIIIFSDGTDIDDFSQIKKLNKNITIYLTATKNPTPIMIEDSYLKDRDNNIVLTKANYKISSIGKVIPYSYKEDNIKIFSSSSKPLDFVLNKFEELYYYPLYCATVTLFFALFSLKRFGLFLVSIYILTFPPTSKALFFDFLDIKKANSAYKNKEYEKAVIEFEKIINSKKTPQSYYNLANAYYKSGKFELALKNYKRVVTKSNKLKYKTFYNIANCYYKLKNYNQAYNFYNLAKSIKTTKKVEKNLQIVQKYIDTNSTKKDFANIGGIVNSTEKRVIDSFKLKTLMIEIAKGDKDEKLNPW